MEAGNPGMGQCMIQNGGGIAVTTKPFGRTAKDRPIHQVQNPRRPVATAGHKKGRYIGTIQKALKVSGSFFIGSGQLVLELANAKTDFDFKASAFHPFNPCPDLIVFNASRRRDQANGVAFAQKGRDEKGFDGGRHWIPEGGIRYGFFANGTQREGCHRPPKHSMNRSTGPAPASVYEARHRSAEGYPG